PNLIWLPCARGDDTPPPGNAQKGASGTDRPKPEAPANEASRPPGSRPDISGFFRQLGDEPPRPFIPLRPATVDDRRRTDALRLYSAARALGDQRAGSDAVALLQEAAKLDPESVAIARRLSRIYIGALGRPDLALGFGRRVLAVEPGDTETLVRLVDYYNAAPRNDWAASESLLNEVLA